MFTNDNVIGSADQLLTRLERRDALRSWAKTEPATTLLTGLQRGFRLGALDPRDADALLSALIRLGAAAGGDDWDALLLLVHLLSPMVTGLARQLRGLMSDPQSAIVSELTVQVRTFPAGGGPATYPLHQRDRCWAGNLRMSVRRSLLDQDYPRIKRGGVRYTAEVTVDGNDRLLDGPLAAPHDEPDVDVVDLLLWAVQTGVDPADVALLIATEAGRDRYQWQGADRRVAQEQGVALRTLYRRRARVLRRVQAVVPDYLAAVA